MKRLSIILNDHLHRDLVRRAREQASLDQDEALEVAVEETRAERGR